MSNDRLFDLCMRLLRAADNHAGARRELLEAYDVILSMMTRVEVPPCG